MGNPQPSACTLLYPRDLLESQPHSLEHVGSSPGSGIECQGVNNSCLGPSQGPLELVYRVTGTLATECHSGAGLKPGSRPGLAQMLRLCASPPYFLYGHLAGFLQTSDEETEVHRCLTRPARTPHVQMMHVQPGFAALPQENHGTGFLHVTGALLPTMGQHTYSLLHLWNSGSGPER